MGEQSSTLFPLTLSSKGSPLQGIFSYLGFMGSLSHGESSIRVGGLGAFSELKGQDQSYVHKYMPWPPRHLHFPASTPHGFG